VVRFFFVIWAAVFVFLSCCESSYRAYLPSDSPRTAVALPVGGTGLRIPGSFDRDDDDDDDAEIDEVIKGISELGVEGK
jgi:hypothetical protein